MTVASILFRCGGSGQPAIWNEKAFDRRISLTHEGAKANINLLIENLSHSLLAAIEGRAADLVRIASYVYVADQTVSRGGLKDVYGEKWRRNMYLAIPVSDWTFWNQTEIVDWLQETLHFLSGDRWRFSFSPETSGSGQMILNTDRQELHGKPDAVVMFSGGADSLAAAVDSFCSLGLRPLLVSHRSSPAMENRQSTLVTELRRRFPTWAFPHISCWVHRRGQSAAETTQRVRPFLFASLGAAVAASMGITHVVFSDNGIVSLNLPVNHQLWGALATRSTHPKFIWFFNRLLKKMLNVPPVVTNTLAYLTRAEAIALLKRNGVPDLLPLTVSCVRVRGRPGDQLHCGTCSQCVDRRFAVMANGLEEIEPSQRYGIDILKDRLPEGEARALATSYVRFAREMHNATGDEIFQLYPQLTECVFPDDPQPSVTAEKLAALLRRQAEGVLKVYASHVTGSQQELVNGWVHHESLMALCSLGTSGVLPETESGLFDHDEDYFNVTFRGTLYTLTPTQAQVIKLLDEARRKSLPEMRQREIGNRIGNPGAEIRNIFKFSPAYRTLLISGTRKGTYRLNL